MRPFTHLAVLLFYSNILKVINTFNYPEGSITESNYDEVIHKLNATNPVAFEQLGLNTCDMEKFLSEVSIEHVADPVVSEEEHNFCNLSFFRVWRGRAWPSSCSQKPSSRCPSLLSGPSCSSSCSSVLDSPLCSATSRE